MLSMTDIAGLAQKDRVHGDVYRDPEIFARELDILFSRHWIFIGHEGEIPNNGDYRQRHIGRQPVIFLRDDKGVVRVLMNRCTHRANAVCHHERGNAKAFTCSYHGWRFRLDGELAVVPYSDRYDQDFDKKSLGLRQVAKVESRRGFVFATLNPDDVPLDEHLGPLVLAELDDIADLSPMGELMVNAGVHKVGFAGNWKLMIENVVDGYHAGPVHRSHFENVLARTGQNPATLTTSASPARIRHLGNGHCTWDSSSILAGGTRSFPGNRPGEEAAKAYHDALIERYGKERAEYLLAKSGTHLYIFPNFSYVGAHFRLIQPMTPTETRVHLFPILLKGAPQEINTRRLRNHEAFYGPAGGGQSDDIEMFERNQIGLAAEVDPWSLLSRGIHLETQHEDGSVSGQITDELSNRAFFARWRELMTESSEGGKACVS
ncbi:aromatic ring-hydroxylating oxygenase subunit alpha [Noviherbaspirillum sedimenti]|uniref:(2Fe-2S)-binding protein n=1 Tax=Noviherbaspirillum sedimenti TaxID=2320865 RepID=A0A3A3GEH2_9BURK|nr:aromatic ring-hydroxylating dioxygenase subunit alpha [Noviherbaspirillum sedimenti]RJG00636.1 (2Fe-2S)-binding protein [Noviherbaspirillum sedimenti]